MTNKEFEAHVFEERRQGRSDSQIARGLGMSLKHLIGKLNGVDVEKVDPPKPVRQEKKPEKKPETKPVSGAKQPEKPKEEKKEEKPIDIPPVTEEPVKETEEEKPAEDLSWME